MNNNQDEHKNENLERPYYGYRVNKYITGASVSFGILGIVLGITFTILSYSIWVLVICWVLGMFLFIFGVFWHLFVGAATDPEKVETLQKNFADELQKLWDGKGKVLDIGTGRGRTAIDIAKRFPEAHVVGVDTWSKAWGYFGMTKEGCETNARIENVSDRCTFKQGNALELPFKDGEFQLVISTFTFHEIHVPDRTVLFEEVVRVLAPSGIFMLCDMFSRGYRVENIPELLQKIEQLGVQDIEHKTLKEAGVDVGKFLHIFKMAYLSGRKMVNG